MALILIADDDEIVVDVVRDALGARGHRVGAVDDGFSVLGVVASKHPDLVILDCNMPEVSGLEALKRLRASRAGCTTPVLMLTARQSEADEWIAMGLGANGYMRKPFDCDRLVVHAEALIAQSDASRQRRSARYVQPTSSELRRGQRLC